MKSVYCFVYRCSRKPEMYIYLPEEDNWSRIPDAILQLLGETQLVLELELTPDRQLARTTGEDVIAAIEHQGFYLQMPPGEPDKNL